MAEYLLQEDGTSYLLQESSVVESVVNGPFGNDAINLRKADFTAATTDIITSNSHGLGTDDRIWVDSSGTLPAGLSNSVLYFVKLIDANTFTVSLTSGGADIDITSTGSGTHTWYTGLGMTQIIANSPNRLLSVFVSYDATNVAAVSSVTFDGTGLTFVSIVIQDLVDPGAGGAGSVIELWKLVAPTNSTTKDVLVKFGAGLQLNPTYAAGIGFSIASKNVHQTTPYGTVFTTEVTGGNTFSTDVTGTSSRGKVIDHIAYTMTTMQTANVGAGQTQRINDLAGNNPQAMRSYTSDEDGTGGTVTMSWTINGGVNVNGMQMAVEILPLSQVVEKILLESSGIAWTQNLSDTVTLSDARVAAAVLSKGDTVTLSDATVKSFLIVKGDTVTLSDQANKTIGIVKGDTVTLSDAAAKAIGVVEGDTVTLSDGLSKSVTLTLSDVTTLSDNSGLSGAITLSDTITLSDQLTAQLSTPAPAAPESSSAWQLMFN